MSYNKINGYQQFIGIMACLTIEILLLEVYKRPLHECFIE
jgi:hypothetical protein